VTGRLTPGGPTGRTGRPPGDRPPRGQGSAPDAPGCAGHHRTAIRRGVRSRRWPSSARRASWPRWCGWSRGSGPPAPQTPPRPPP